MQKDLDALESRDQKRYERVVADHREQTVLIWRLHRDDADGIILLKDRVDENEFHINNLIEKNKELKQNQK